LTPVTQEFVPGVEGKQTVEFKHEYGTVSISSDRPDSKVSIAGVDLGKLPVDAILPPGQHQIVVRSGDLPDQSKTVNVRIGQKISMQVSFSTTSGVAATLTQRPENSDEESVQPTPKPARPKPARTEQPTVYRTKEDYDRAKDAAYNRFDAEWEARKNALKRQKDYYDYQADHSEGAAKERWKAKKDEIDHRLDQLDDEKDRAKSAMKRQWHDD
jgi:PEGA domain